MQPTDGRFPDTYETANDRMKRDAEAWLPRSIVLAVLLHVALFSFTPTMSAAIDDDVRGDDMLVIPPTLELPPPPEEIARPAAPVVGEINVSDDVTIPPMSIHHWTPDMLPPPARTQEREAGGFERFMPSMVAPRLLNPEEVQRELVRRYPSVLRDAGIGGEVDVNLWLDENGRIVKAEIGRTSGYELLDAAALEVVSVMKLTAAQNRGVATRVIVALPVVFTVR